MVDDNSSNDIIEYPSSSTFPDEKDNPDDFSGDSSSSSQETKTTVKTCYIKEKIKTIIN